MISSRILIAFLLASGAAAARHAAIEPDDGSGLPGGATTVDVDGRNAFSLPAANLTDDERSRFAIGNSFFRRNWVEAPSSTRARDGLGPHFIARSCGGCHAQDGRGAPPDLRKGLSAPKPAASRQAPRGGQGNLGAARRFLVSEQPVALLIRLSVPGANPHGGPQPEPVYGDQLNNAAVQGVRSEGQITIRHDTVGGRFADGTPYTLRKPVYGFKNLGYGPMAPDVMLSPRIAPQLIGVGLLEAIPEAEIERNAREQAAAGGPVRGVPNRVWDAFAEKTMIGRFGWKANVATLAHQSAGAFLGDMGITSSRFADEACTAAQSDCRRAPRGAQGKAPEIDDDTLGHVVFYQSTLAPPARRDIGDAQLLKGQQLFTQAQCATCHRPSYVTAEGPFPRLTSKALSGQRIWPYTDLLLHDMGEGLADGRPDFLANGRQWKTPPLWGIGRIKEVNGHTRLLHDGRARGVLEAILWHGGEAQASRDRVLKMSEKERDALVKFVESL